MKLPSRPRRSPSSGWVGVVGRPVRHAPPHDRTGEVGAALHDLAAARVGAADVGTERAVGAVEVVEVRHLVDVVEVVEVGRIHGLGKARAEEALTAGVSRRPVGQRQRHPVAPPAHQLGRHALLVPHGLAGGRGFAVAPPGQLVVDLPGAGLEELLEPVHVLLEHPEGVEAAVHAQLDGGVPEVRLRHLPADPGERGAVVLGRGPRAAAVVDAAEEDRTDGGDGLGIHPAHVVAVHHEAGLRDAVAVAEVDGVAVVRVVRVGVEGGAVEARGDRRRPPTPSTPPPGGRPPPPARPCRRARGSST